MTSSSEGVGGTQCFGNCIGFHPYLRMETDPISETLCSLEYRTMDKVLEPNNPKSQVFIEISQYGTFREHRL
jgi:hypothetical protein